MIHESGQMSLTLGEAHLDKAMQKMEMKHKDILELAREIAEKIILRNGSACIDDVRERLGMLDTARDKSNNWMGAIFRPRRFRAVAMCRSKLASNHGRMVRVYTLENVRIKSSHE
jgi:hypothetical protein